MRHSLFAQAHFCEATTQIRMERWKETVLANKMRQSHYQLPIHKCKYFLYEIKQGIIDSLWSMKQKLIEIHNNNDWNIIIRMKTLCLVLRLIFRVIWLKLLRLMTINMIWWRMLQKVWRNTSTFGSWLLVNCCSHGLDHSSARTINYFTFSHNDDWKHNFVLDYFCICDQWQFWNCSLGESSPANTAYSLFSINPWTGSSQSSIGSVFSSNVDLVFRYLNKFYFYLTHFIL